MLKTPREASNKDTKPQRTTRKARNATKLEANRTNLANLDLDNMEGWSQKKGTPNCSLRNKVPTIAVHQRGMHVAF